MNHQISPNRSQYKDIKRFMAKIIFLGSSKAFDLRFLQTRFISHVMTQIQNLFKTKRSLKFSTGTVQFQDLNFDRNIPVLGRSGPIK